MGKISRALDKYTSERKAAPAVTVPAASPLTHADILALVGYDRKSGHLLPSDHQTGLVDQKRIEELRAGGTILRLLENELIYPGGKLTARGVEEARRLDAIAAAIPRRPEVQPAERELLATAQKRAAEQALPAQAPAEARREPEPANLPAFDAEDDLIEAYSTPPHATRAEPEPAVQPAPLQAVPETPPAAAVPPAPPAETAAQREAARPAAAPMWDEAAIDPNLVTMTAPQSPEAEQFKILRTNILFPLAGSPPRSILVTSSAPGEGKTFSAANLAVSIALNINRHVLLIDADLRQPALHKRFGFGPVPGLSTYLAEGIPLPGLLLKTKVEKLTLLPAGPPPDNPAELIGAERMSSLLAEVTNRYPDRIVVIDTPPPALAAETSVLARQVDGILLVVRYGKTRRDELADTVAQLGEKKILGSIVNCIETAASRYYGYKYGGPARPPKR